jgi:hypothetical protein
MTLRFHLIFIEWIIYYSNVPGPSLSLSMMQLDIVCSLRDGIEIVPHFHYIQEEEACWVLLLPLYISSYNWRLLRLPQQFSTINSLYCFLFSIKNIMTLRFHLIFIEWIIYYSNFPGPSLSLSMMQLDNVCSLRDGIEIVPHFYYIQEEEACWVLLLPMF